jgi:tetratricopeptide (TPR) repeat protein
MGGFKCLERLKEYEEILDAFQEIGHLFSSFPLLHVEKCKIFIALSDYENAIDYIDSKVNLKHFEVSKILAVCNLINEGDFQNAYTNIEKMWDLLIFQEPKNPELYYSTAQLFSRICDKRPNIIRKCEQMIDKALEFNPRNSKFLIEKGYCRLYQNDIDKAFLLFTQAGEIDINNKDSSIGTIYCKIINKKYKEAIEDIEFIKEIFISLNLPLSPKITYYQALIKFMDGEKEEVISSIISESLNTHVKLARQGNYNKYDILIATDYDFLYELAKSNLYV